MKITLNQLKKWSACESGYRKIAKHLGSSYPKDKEFDALILLESNDVEDCIWTLSHDPDAHEFQSLMIDIVAPMADINTDKRVVNCIQALRDFRDGRITRDELLRAAYAVTCAAYAITYAAVYTAALAAEAVRDAARAACNRVYYAAYYSTLAVALAAALAVGDDEYIKNLITEYYQS